VETSTPDILPSDLPSPGELDEGDRESYGITEDAIAKLQEIHGTIRACSYKPLIQTTNYFKPVSRLANSTAPS
jgi:hypothetical protein